MVSQIQVRRDTAANWTANNPTLAAGEIGYETDTDQFKIGDGATNWVGLTDYFESGSGDVASDDIWDAAGDLAVGTGADTAAKLSAGNNDDVLTVVGGTAAWAVPATHAATHLPAGGDTIADATTDQHGFMTDTQFDKLDGIAAGADVTGSNAPQAHDLDSHLECTIAELSADVSDATLASIANIATHAALTTTHGVAGSIEDTAHKGAANGYAELGADTKVPTAQLPAIALTDVYTCANEVCQLALTVEEGDLCIRTDESKSYVALNADNVDMGDWQELLSPTGAVTSVFGRNGVVVAVAGDYNETKGGTGQTAFVEGDILYADGANSLNKLTKGADNTTLTMNGNVPNWETVNAANIADGSVSNTEFQHLDGVTADIQGQIDDISFSEKFYINGSPDGALTDFQVKLHITYKTGMEVDFDDIRFKDIDGTNIPYWLESKTNSQDAYVWIKTSIPVNGKAIYMTYGDGAASASSGANTFIQYHGAATANFTDAFNVPLGAVIYEGRVKTTGATSTIIWGLTDHATWHTDESLAIMSTQSTDLRYIRSGHNGVLTDKSESPKFVQDTWYNIKAIHTGTAVTGFVNDNQISSGDITTNLSDEAMGLFMDLNTSTGAQDWSFARKYTANEPTVDYFDRILSSTPGLDHSVSGITSIEPVGSTAAFGDILYLALDGDWTLPDASAAATMPALRMATCATIDGTSYELLSIGFARDDTWNWTVGGAIYVSITGTTGNTLTQTAPNGSGDQVQIVGIATHADRIWFNPDFTMVEIV